MLLTTNLFEEHEIIISMGSPRRKPIIKTKHFANHIEAMYEYFKIAKIRLRHGYKQLEE